jgi:D-3-phosphoglycerate dehydrogenase
MLRASTNRLLRRSAPNTLYTAARALSSAPGGPELELLEQLLKSAKARQAAAAAAEAAEASAGGPRFQIQTFNAISPIGLKGFPEKNFALTGSSGKLPNGVDEEPHAVLLRSHKLQSAEVASTVRAIARCGAGTNNIPIDEMTKRGIPVFNTPGANANAVKELVLCAMLLASRGIVEGIVHTKNKIVPEEPDHKAIAARIEKDKKHFVGQELLGKTLAVCGLGNIGAMVAEAGLALGMNVVGYDPKISVDAAWRLPNTVVKLASLEDAFAQADFVTINMPYIKGVTHHAISAEVLSKMKPTTNILNMARGEIVDGEALIRMYDNGHKGKYICDFADEFMQSHPNFICIPHLGASTAEAEDNCAEMAAEQIIKFLETGAIKNSVNFPTANLDRQDTDSSRLCIINENQPGVLSKITATIADKGFNIAQQLNTSRDAIAYNVIDIDDFSPDAAGALQEELIGIDGVLSTRVIWTGSAQEGPANFLTKV